MQTHHANPSLPNHDTYRHRLHQPLTHLVIVAPLLVVYHIGVRLAPSGLWAPQYIRDVLPAFEVLGQYLPAVLIVVVLLFQHVTRKDPWRVDPWTVGGAVVESAVWVAPLLAMSWGITSVAAPAAMNGLGGRLIEAVGAGVYEEFLFRLCLIQILVLLAVDLCGGKAYRLHAILGAIVISGLLFASMHADVWNGQTPNWSKFAFLALAGAWWGVLLAWRGFAVAVLCHVYWDVLIVLLGRG